MPMVRSFILSKKKGQTIYIEPVLDENKKSITFEIKLKGTPQKETTNRNEARCLYCENVIKKDQLRKTSSTHGLEEIPYMVICESQRKKIFIPFPEEHLLFLDRPSC